MYVYILVFFLSAFFVSSFCFTFVCLFCLPICVLKRGKEGGELELDMLGCGKDQGGDEAGKHD